MVTFFYLLTSYLLLSLSVACISVLSSVYLLPVYSRMHADACFLLAPCSCVVLLSDVVVASAGKPAPFPLCRLSILRPSMHVHNMCVCILHGLHARLVDPSPLARFSCIAAGRPFCYPSYRKQCDNTPARLASPEAGSEYVLPLVLSQGKTIRPSRLESPDSYARLLSAVTAVGSNP